MASASCRETARRLPPRVAQPRPSAVTSTEVRPILRFSKAGIAVSLLLPFHIASFERAYTARTLVREAGARQYARKVHGGSGSTVSAIPAELFNQAQKAQA